VVQINEKSEEEIKIEIKRHGDGLLLQLSQAKESGSLSVQYREGMDSVIRFFDGRFSWIVLS